MFSDRVSDTRRSTSQKRIHDMRVATRRLRSILDIIETLIPGKPIAKLRKRLKRHMRPFGTHRDLQLQRRTVRALLVQFPFLRDFDTELKARELLTTKRLERELAAIALDAYEKNVDEIQIQVRSLIAEPSVDEAAEAVVRGVLAHAYLQAAALKRSAMSGRIALIHRFRISFKRLRYMIESLRPILPPLPDTFFAAMNGYQTRMGMIQDHEVLVNALVNWNKRHKNLDAGLREACMIHLEQRGEELKSAFLAAANEFEGFWEALQPQQRRNGQHEIVSPSTRDRRAKDVGRRQS